MDLANAAFGKVYHGTQGSPARENAVRERNPNCIEMHLKNIEAELAESMNSSANLADKLSGEGPQQVGANAPVQTGLDSVQGRLEQIVNTLRSLNQQLGRAHGAISG